MKKHRIKFEHEGRILKGSVKMYAFLADCVRNKCKNVTVGFGEKNLKIPGAVDYYCNCWRYSVNEKEIHYINDLINKKETEINELVAKRDFYLNDCSKYLTARDILDFLKAQKRRLEELNENLFSHKLTQNKS